METHKTEKIEEEINKLFDSKNARWLRYISSRNKAPLELRLLAGKLAIDLCIAEKDWDELTEIMMHYPPLPQQLSRRARKEYARHGEEITEMHVRKGNHYAVKSISECSDFPESLRSYARERIYDAEKNQLEYYAKNGLYDHFITGRTFGFSERTATEAVKRINEVVRRHIDICVKTKAAYRLDSVMFKTELPEEIRIEAGEKAINIYLEEERQQERALGLEKLFYFSLNTKLPEKVRIKAGEKYIEECISCGYNTSLYEFKDLVDFLAEGTERIYCPGNPPPRRKYRELMADLRIEDVPKPIRQKLNSKQVTEILERKNVREAVYWSRFNSAICF